MLFVKVPGLSTKSSATASSPFLCTGRSSFEHTLKSGSYAFLAASSD